MRRAVATVALLLIVPFVGARPRSAPPRESLTLCVVVDVTASMAQAVTLRSRVTPSGALHVTSEAGDGRASVAISGLPALLVPGDRARIGRVARVVAFSPEFVAPDSLSDAARVLDAPEADRLGPSPIWDATDQALRLLEPEGGRRAVVVWTDGRASGNRLSRHDVARRARALAIPIHVVSPPTENIIQQSETLAVRIRPSVYLEWLAEATGGRFQTAALRGDPIALLREVLDAIRRS